MSSACLSPARLTAFLVGDLDPEEDGAVAEHLEQCPACERMAAEFSDDLEARELAAAAEGKSAAGNEPQVEDLCRRLHALGLYELAVQAEESDTDSGNAPGPRRTTVFRAVPKPQTPLETSAAAFIPPGLGPTEEVSPLSPRLKRIGRYEIVRALGAGSFGVVYLAHDYKLNRPVALKIARPSVLADDHLRLRFIREAVTLAKLEHPHIVPVYEADEVEGICYLAIAFCDGPTLDHWLREQGGRIDPWMAVKLLLPLVDAVEHAHAHGVLHRDIKPANVILQTAHGENDELPLVPRLTDFGLAKIVEEPSNSTLSGIVLGTAQYMAPEQAAGHIERIGAATDVYALGAVLYQMLTGRPPIEGKTNIDTLRRLLIDEPVEVRRLVRGVPADLDAIVLRCLHKTVGERYQTAAELAADLRRFLAGQTTLARPLKLRQRASRWLARNPTLTGLIALSVLVVGLSIGLYVSAQQILYSHEQKNIAENLAKRREAELARTIRLRDYANDIRTAAQAAAAGDMTGVITALRRHAPFKGMTEDVRGLEWYYLWELATQRPLAEAEIGQQVYQIRLSPNGREVALACNDSDLRILDVRTFDTLATIPTGQVEINGIAYSPDGRLIATAGDDSTVRLFDLETREEKKCFRGHQGKVFGVAFFDGGNKLVSCGEEAVVRLWDVGSGQPAGELNAHKEAVEALAVFESPVERKLATVSSDQTCILWDLQSQTKHLVLGEHLGKLSSVAFSPDGRLLAVGSLEDTVNLWDLTIPRRVAAATHHDGVQTVTFCAEGKCLFAGDRSGSVRRHEIVAGTVTNPYKLVTTHNWQAHEHRVWCAIPSVDPGKVVSSGQDGRLRTWATSPQDYVRQVLPATEEDRVIDLAFGGVEGEFLFALHQNSGIEVLDGQSLSSKRRLERKEQEWTAIEVLDDRAEVAAATADGRVIVFNWKTGQARTLIEFGEPRPAIMGLIYSPKAGLLAVLPFDAHNVELFRAADGRHVATLPTNNHASAAISPDGKRLAVDSLNNIYVYDIATHEAKRPIPAHRATVVGLAYRPQGDLLASASSDRTLRLWNRDGSEQPLNVQHLFPLVDAAFTPDGKTLVSIDEAGTLRLTNHESDRVLLDIPTDAKSLRSLAIAPDSRRLAVIREDHSVLLIGKGTKESPQRRDSQP
jgi:serine/threonine protein kinase/WD40 repeat protein